MIDCEKCVNHKICKAEEKDKVDSCAFVNYGMTKEEMKIRADERTKTIDECMTIANEFDFYINDGVKSILIKHLEMLKEQKNET